MPGASSPVQIVLALARWYGRDQRGCEHDEARNPFPHNGLPWVDGESILSHDESRPDIRQEARTSGSANARRASFLRAVVARLLGRKPF